MTWSYLSMSETDMRAGERLKQCIRLSVQALRVEAYSMIGVNGHVCANLMPCRWHKTAAFGNSSGRLAPRDVERKKASRVYRKEEKCSINIQERMILIVYLAVLIAVLGRETASQSCSLTQDGVILKGNTCRFKCCLGGIIYEMKSLRATGFCPGFSESGAYCMESGIKFPHGMVIKYNILGCFVCNNGRQVQYKNAKDVTTTDEFPDYTLVRFG